MTQHAMGPAIDDEAAEALHLCYLYLLGLPDEDTETGPNGHTGMETQSDQEGEQDNENRANDL